MIFTWKFGKLEHSLELRSVDRGAKHSLTAVSTMIAAWSVLDDDDVTPLRNRFRGSPLFREAILEEYFS